MINAKNLYELSKEELIDLCKIYAKNWLAHDGSWFLSVEEKFGMDSAVEMDREAWRKFTVVEATRLISFLKLGTDSGIEGLKKAISFRLYSTLNVDEISIEDENTLIYRVKTCRVQDARRRKNLDFLPCKSVGFIEYSLFAKTIDNRIETEILSCPPDITDHNYYCIWKFSLKKSGCGSHDQFVKL